MKLGILLTWSAIHCTLAHLSAQGYSALPTLSSHVCEPAYSLHVLTLALTLPGMLCPQIFKYRISSSFRFLLKYHLPESEAFPNNTM